MLIVECNGGAKQGKHGLSCLRPTGMYVLAWLRTQPAICPSWGRCELPVQLLWRPRVTYNS